MPIETNNTQQNENLKDMLKYQSAAGYARKIRICPYFGINLVLKHGKSSILLVIIELIMYGQI